MEWNIKDLIVFIEYFWSSISKVNIPIKDYNFWQANFVYEMSCCYRCIVEKTKSLNVAFICVMTWGSYCSKHWIALIEHKDFITTFYRSTSSHKCRVSRVLIAIYITTNILDFLPLFELFYFWIKWVLWVFGSIYLFNVFLWMYSK